MRLARILILIVLAVLGFYIIAAEQSFISGTLREAYHQLSAESQNSRVGRLLWNSHGIHHLFLLGSLVWMFALFGLCMECMAWQKMNPRVLVATMFLIAYFVFNTCAINIPYIPGSDDVAIFFGIFPVFPILAIMATWVFFWKSRGTLKRWKLAGVIFTTFFVLLGCFTTLALAAIWGSI